MIRTLLVAFLHYGGAGSTADADAATFASNCTVMEGRDRSAAKTTLTPPATEELLVYMKEVLALACSSARRRDDGSSVPENDAAAVDAAVAAAIAAAVRESLEIRCAALVITSGRLAAAVGAGVVLAVPFWWLFAAILCGSSKRSTNPSSSHPKSD